MILNMRDEIMKTNILSIILYGCIACSLAACGNGQSTAQNMPYDGTTPFTGTMTPGIGQGYITTNGGGCNVVGNGSPENISFYVTESSPVVINDTSLQPSANPLVNYGYFTNPVNQNNPCFTGKVIVSGCANLQNATIIFNGCSVPLIGNHYQFTATYTIQAPGYYLSGTINANK